MEPWTLWIIFAIALGLGELHSNGFFVAPFAIGAALAAVVSLAGLGLAIAVAIFLAGSLLSLGLLRPLAMRHRRVPPLIRTGTAALIGRHAVVVERIANGEGVGCVKIGGEVWTARSYEDDGVIEAGAQVEVVEIRGATALVLE
ncbi:MAG TPA: NfeD family protein [Solirubrobacteraceae bacterium]|jgi:membrane protein implicated in regulation of membrane protease activity|nr:NfeD family protein [Solirubrobacteraceae bacterium]